MGTVPHAAILESIENLGRRVIPYFRARYGKGEAKRHFTEQEAA